MNARQCLVLAEGAQKSTKKERNFSADEQIQHLCEISVSALAHCREINCIETQLLGCYKQTKFRRADGITKPIRNPAKTSAQHRWILVCGLRKDCFQKTQKTLTTFFSCSPIFGWMELKVISVPNNPTLNLWARTAGMGEDQVNVYILSFSTKK